MTWKELKEVCSSMTDKQLNNDVVVWLETESLNRLEVDKLIENYYRNEELDYLVGQSELNDYPDDMDFELVYKKGDYIILELI